MVPSLIVQHFSCGLFVFVVAQHDVDAACYDFAFNMSWVGGSNLHFHAWQGCSARAGLEVVVVAIGNQWGAFRRAVTYSNGEVNTL